MSEHDARDPFVGLTQHIRKEARGQYTPAYAIGKVISVKPLVIRADGMDLDKADSKEARILSEILDVLKEVGDQLDNVDATLDEFSEEIDAISDDLSDVEEVVFDDEDDDDEDFDEDEDDFFEVECPNCGEDLVIDDEVLEAGTIDCPACGQKFSLSFDDCGEEGCDCGSDEE